MCLSGHTETLTAAQTFSKADIKLIGEGSGSNRPKFTRNGDVNMFDITAAGVVVWNIYFPASASASTKSRWRTAGANSNLRDCYFECGANDTGPAAETITGAGSVVVRGTSFVSTATTVSAQPSQAMKVTNAITDLELDTVVFDGGTTGWSNQYAFNAAGAVTRLRALSLDLLNDSDVTIVTGSSGYVTVRNKSGSARVVWAA